LADKITELAKDRESLMDDKLSQGNYYGEIVRRGDIAGLILTETLYPARVKVPHHSHEDPYICLVLKGSFTETYGRKSRECSAMTLAFHPQGEIHSQHFHNVGVHSFNVEVERDYEERVRQYSAILDYSADFHGGFLAWLGIKLFNEFRQMDKVSPLAIEGLLLEIIAAASRSQDKISGKRPARWLEQARELLHARFAETLTAAEIADAVDVHPVHLAREFHKYYQCTIGEYLRKLRIDFACHEIISSDSTLAEIALGAGFFDQSHFSRTFKCHTGLTPTEFRETFRSR